MYPGVGTFVLIRPTQTFYERIKIERNRLGYKVPSQSGNGTYVVSLDDVPFCTCPDFEVHQAPCKHIYAVEYTIQRETKPDGSSTVTESIKVTQTSEWTVYNQAQTHEAERFTQLLQAVCEGIPNPPQQTGRPRLPLSDVVYSLASRAYSTMSGRRHASALHHTLWPIGIAQSRSGPSHAFEIISSMFIGNPGRSGAPIRYPKIPKETAA